MSFKRFARTFFGASRTGALKAGEIAPAISLRSTSGREFSLADALEKGPVLATFFKVNCPTCRFTFPFLERIHEMYSGSSFAVWGISQNDAADTGEFLAEFGVEFPALIDGEGYPASNQYGLTNVPTMFLIAPDGKIQASCVGFSKADLEKIAAEAARATAKPAAPLFKPGEIVPEYKPG